MANFVDGGNLTWNVELDGLMLGELKDKGVDIVVDGLFLIETREDLLTKALLVICREQINEKKLSDNAFARLIRGDVQGKAIEAVRGAAQVFFRPSRWSEIQSLCKTKKETEEQFRTLRPMLDILNGPDMPPAMREAVMAFIGDKIESAMAGQSSVIPPSASGPDASPLNAAGVSLAT